MNARWIEQFRVESVMKATGASADDARAYLVAEEGSVEGAIMSCKGDRLDWRATALENAKHAEMARATARVAINHLQSVLNKPRTHAQQQDVDTAARDWLLSIGSEPQ